MLGFVQGRGKHSTNTPSKVVEDEKISLDPILTRLQMEVRLVIADFEYNVDRRGNRYGWGIARYTHPKHSTVHSASSAHPLNRSSVFMNTSATYFQTQQKANS